MLLITFPNKYMFSLKSKIWVLSMRENVITTGSLQASRCLAHTLNLKGYKHAWLYPYYSSMVVCKLYINVEIWILSYKNGQATFVGHR